MSAYYYFFFLCCVFSFLACQEKKQFTASKKNIKQPLAEQFIDFNKKAIRLENIYYIDLSNYTNQHIKQLLLFIKEKDQEERLKFHRVYLKKGWKEAIKAYNFEKNDSLCTYLFSQINNKVGFPDTLRFGKEADSVVFLLLAHAPHNYRLRYIDAWEKSVRAKTSRADLFADIKDRVNIVDEGCQLYATQKVLREKDSCFLTICNLTKLNKRRKAIGLLPMNLKKIKQSRY